MKRLHHIWLNFINDPRVLAFWTVIVLLIPNVVLNHTEDTSTVWRLVNLLFPAGVYLLLLMAKKRTGVMVLWLIPFMVFAAFQIVLLYLYGESIIAVDMYLNIVTTNMSEATELLSNLTFAIVVVVLLFIPVIAWGVYATVKKLEISRGARREIAVWGGVAALLGVALALVARWNGERGEFHREVFPINVICNLGEAVSRTVETANYAVTSAPYTFEAASVRPEREREIYVYVIGETSRAENWQLGGYRRATNPRLSQEKNVVFYSKALSESNTTHKSVPMLLSAATAESFDSINHCKSIITAMKEAGFHTSFFSNQAPNRSYTEFFGNEADDTRYTSTSVESHPYDGELLDMVREAVADTVHPKQFIVLHTYGSHFKYSDRYPQEDEVFTPVGSLEASPENRDRLLNGYDNSIRYTDALLAEIIAMLKAEDCPACLLYSSDHGEDIFDDARERFLHASPTPTYHQLHVAMLSWVSDRFCERHAAMARNLIENADKLVSPQESMFHTAMELAGVDSPRVRYSDSLANSAYRPGEPVYLTDLNRAVPLMDSGVKKEDKKQLMSLINA